MDQKHAVEQKYDGSTIAPTLETQMSKAMTDLTEGIAYFTADRLPLYVQLGMCTFDTLCRKNFERVVTILCKIFCELTTDPFRQSIGLVAGNPSALVAIFMQVFSIAGPAGFTPILPPNADWMSLAGVRRIVLDVLGQHHAGPNACGHVGGSHSFLCCTIGRFQTFMIQWNNFCLAQGDLFLTLCVSGGMADWRQFGAQALPPAPVPPAPPAPPALPAPAAPAPPAPPAPDAAAPAPLAAPAPAAPVAPVAYMCYRCGNRSRDSYMCYTCGAPRCGTPS